MFRQVIRQTLLTLAALASTTPVAADCPSLEGQTIRWIVPSKPGGGYDAYSRLIRPFLQRRLNVRIVVENRPEAGGIVAAMAVRDADTDSKTLGLINASGLLAASLVPDSPAPDPSQDFTVLARVVSNSMFLFTGRDSGIADIRELMQASANRTVVLGVRDVGSASFFAVPVMAAYLGLNHTLVTGYNGSSARVLAAMRGDVDLIVQTLDSVRPYVDSGELVPLLQLSGPPPSGRGRLPATVPRAGGPVHPDPATRGPAAKDANSKAAALAAILSAGRLVVAPAGLPQALESCLQSAALDVLQGPELKTAADNAGLTVEPAGAATAMEDLQASKRRMASVAPLVRAAMEQARR